MTLDKMLTFLGLVDMFLHSVYCALCEREEVQINYLKAWEPKRFRTGQCVFDSSLQKLQTHGI